MSEAHLRRYNFREKTRGMYTTSNYCHRGRQQFLVSLESFHALRKTEPNLLCDKCLGVVLSFEEDAELLLQYEQEAGMAMLNEVET